MLLHAREQPIQLLYLDALLRRTSSGDPSFDTIQNQHNRLHAGFIGECIADREWLDFLIPINYRLFHNLELQNKQHTFHQIDTLLLTCHFVIIFEIKNIAGTLSYAPDYYEFSRMHNGVTERFHNPFTQAARHQQFIQQLLNDELPVLYAVVITHSKAMLDATLKGLPIFHLNGLRNYIQQQVHEFPKAKLSLQELDAFSKTLLQLNSPRPIRRLSPAPSIKKGVLCTCGYPMSYQRGDWCCSRCEMSDNAAIKRALHDYRLLVSKHITNKAFRDFTGMQSADAATRLLFKLNLPFEGQNRGRIYTIPADIWTSLKKN